MPVAELWKIDPKEQRSPYGSYWYRAVACILLSGRIQPKADGAPNMTDVNRLGKEANFNQYLIERVGKFLVAIEAIRVDRLGRYEAGPNLAAFWDRDVERLETVTRQAVLFLARNQTGDLSWRPKTVDDSHLIEFLSLFFASFRGLALVESQFSQVLHDFSLLPQDDLIQAAQGLGLVIDSVDVAGWRQRLDAKGQKALITALSTAEWAYYAEHEKTGWYFASPIGLAMLGLQPLPPAPELATVFKALPNLSVFAGAGLAWETLVPLFRYGRIKRIDQVYEFHLDRKSLAESSSTRSPGEELRQALGDLEPLPPAVMDLLATKSKAGGKIDIRWCSALVKPESAEVLAAIREHPQLKGYLEPGAPPGYLLIKPRSNPDNFVERCRKLGFEV
jgi:hypothetical protein